MNPVELYKKLPRTNCGACAQKACMPFAFALLKGEASLQDCPSLSEDLKAELAAVVTTSDWREDLIAALKEDIKAIPFEAVAGQLGAELKNRSLSLRYFGQDILIGPDGEIEASGRLTPWMRMLLLFYVKNRGSGPLSGTWVEHSELRGGLMKSKAFKRECEEPLRDLLDRNLRAVASCLEAYGAQHPQGFSSPWGWLIHLLPNVPVLILYWPEEDEFGSKVTIRFDSTADRFFDVEQIIFLVEELVKQIEASL